jgi:hypothetical protein
MPVVLHPHLVAAARMDPTLVYMIQNGLPLTELCRKLGDGVRKAA